MLLGSAITKEIANSSYIRIEGSESLSQDAALITMTTILVILLILAACTTTHFFIEWKQERNNVAAIKEHYNNNVIPAFNKRIEELKEINRRSENERWDACQVIKLLEQERDMLIKLGYTLATKYAGFKAVEQAIETKRLIGWIAANETEFAKWHRANPNADDELLIDKFKELAEEQEVYPLSDTKALFNA